MVELSIEQKAQTYDKALERAREWYNDPHITIGLKGNLKDIFPELKESEDEKIRIALIKGLRAMKSNFRTISSIKIDDAIAWLEKQSNQKKSYDTCDSSMMDNKKSPDSEKRDFGYFEETSADKDDSKFHEGDWITIDKPYQIISTKDNGNYIVRYCNDKNTHVLSKNLCDSYFHLWTIEDAKEGDVLATDKGVFIYAKVLYNKPYAYCGVDKFGVFKDNCLNNNWANSVDNIHPATKEQRDLLFQKMKEEGYEWDVYKKELKKIKMTDLMEDYIEQEPVKWNEEDEKKLSDILAILRGGENCYYNSPILIDWLKLLKERIGG